MPGFLGRLFSKKKYGDLLDSRHDLKVTVKAKKTSNASPPTSQGVMVSADISIKLFRTSSRSLQWVKIITNRALTASSLPQMPLNCPLFALKFWLLKASFYNLLISKFEGGEGKSLPWGRFIV